MARRRFPSWPAKAATGFAPHADARTLGVKLESATLYRLSYEMTFWSQGGKQRDLMRPVSAMSAFQ
ncbi:hypothetical protein, partial [Azospirillum agricola]|uniref:hypothetical protein n=1 Tax=Azospirillum agricola TaxID=1720247 RepID=UPI001AE63D26